MLQNNYIKSISLYKQISSHYVVYLKLIYVNYISIIFVKDLTPSPTKKHYIRKPVLPGYQHNTVDYRKNLRAEKLVLIYFNSVLFEKDY